MRNRVRLSKHQRALLRLLAPPPAKVLADRGAGLGHGRPRWAVISIAEAPGPNKYGLQPVGGVHPRTVSSLVLHGLIEAVPDTAASYRLSEKGQAYTERRRWGGGM